MTAPQPLICGNLEARFTLERGGNVVRTVVSRSLEGEEGLQLSWADVLQGLSAEGKGEGSDLRDLLSQALLRMPFEAFFWECPPLSLHTQGRPFEFVAVDAPCLATIKADSETFSDHLRDLDGQEKTRAFFNLGGDALLVAPSHARHQDPSTYAHIARFFRCASRKHQHQMWKGLVQAIKQRLQEVGDRSNLWVSTDGRAVHWLHMRIDQRPKYYDWAEYRNPEYGLAEEKPADLMAGKRARMQRSSSHLPHQPHQPHQPSPTPLTSPTPPTSSRFFNCPTSGDKETYEFDQGDKVSLLHNTVARKREVCTQSEVAPRGCQYCLGGCARCPVVPVAVTGGELNLFRQRAQPCYP